EILALPAGRLTGAEFRAPVLPRGKVVLPAANLVVKREDIERTRLLVVRPGGSPAQHDESLQFRRVAHGHIPALADDPGAIQHAPGVGGDLVACREVLAEKKKTENGGSLRHEPEAQARVPRQSSATVDNSSLRTHGTEPSLALRA